MRRRRRAVLALATLVVGAAGCGGGGGGDTTPDAAVFVSPYTKIEASTQRPGDAAAGYSALVNKGYVNCGIPYSLYSQAFGVAPERERLDGREGRNPDLPYYQTAFTTKSGVEVVSANCLICHMGEINGELVLGLGNNDRDYTIDAAATVNAAASLVTDPAERAEILKFAERMTAIAPYTRTRTIGANPADNLAAVLFAHRDPVTLAWSKTPLLPLPPEIVVPVDVPPWWRMKKKTSMFYVAAGRGDHARIMSTASTLCSDTVAEAEEMDVYFPDVAAYINTLTPPPYPFAVDTALAERGKVEFGKRCAECHGTYGEGATFPNLLIPDALIGTDTTLSLGAGQFADVYIDWFNSSWYGQKSHLQPERGYLAPPLDGIWATAPFLHNGSVPTIAALLDTSKRPKYWTRTFRSTDYDDVALGWQYTELPAGQDAEPNQANKKKIYDTTLLGYGNGGHDFGDGLSADDRTAIIEYLKTL